MAETKKVYHVSSYEIGRFKDGFWHCAHDEPAVENRAGTRSGAFAGMRFWACDRNKHSKDECRFFLWEDHLEEAISHHNLPEDVAARARQTPVKRKRDGDIRDFYRSPKTPKTPRTVDARAVVAVEDESPTARVSGPSRPRRDLSPSPLPKPAAKSMLPSPTPAPAPARARLTEVPSAPVPVPSVPVRAAPPAVSPPTPGTPRTPASTSRTEFTLEQRPKPPAFVVPPTPSRRRLSSPELKAYNVAIRALSAERVGLTLKGQNDLREIIKEESFRME